MKLWAYCKKLGITVIADCPFYVGIDSVDCWLNKDQFLMDENYHPTLVSGCPPDAFSDDEILYLELIRGLVNQNSNDDFL